MPNLRMNFSKAEVITKLGLQDAEKEGQWKKFEIETSYQYKTNPRLALDPTLPWGSLPSAQKEAALSELREQCKLQDLDWGDDAMPRAVEWRLYNLHHSAMKSRKRSIRIAGDSTQEATASGLASPSPGYAEAEVDPARSTPSVTTPSAMYDPVRDAAEAN